MPYPTKEAQRAYQREWVATRRRTFFSTQRCADCSTCERLELHHVDPATKVTHRIWTRTKEAFEEERRKCIVLCHDCHRNRHYPQRGQHGMALYRLGCRCDVCRGANTERWKRQDRRRH